MIKFWTMSKSVALTLLAKIPEYLIMRKCLSGIWRIRVPIKSKTGKVRSLVLFKRLSLKVKVTVCPLNLISLVSAKTGRLA